MISPIDRVVLIDILKNPGATKDQVRYRVRGQSPRIINQSIDRLVSSGDICYLSNKLTITALGRKNLRYEGMVRV